MKCRARAALPALFGVAYVWTAEATPCSQFSAEDELRTDIDRYLQQRQRVKRGRKGDREGKGALLLHFTVAETESRPGFACLRTTESCEEMTGARHGSENKGQG
jgi:hypothetical protein